MWLLPPQPGSYIAYMPRPANGSPKPSLVARFLAGCPCPFVRTQSPLPTTLNAVSPTPTWFLHRIYATFTESFTKTEPRVGGCPMSPSPSCTLNSCIPPLYMQLPELQQGQYIISIPPFANHLPNSSRMAWSLLFFLSSFIIIIIFPCYQ